MVSANSTDAGTVPLSALLQLLSKYYYIKYYKIFVIL